MRHAPFYGWIHDLSAPDPTTWMNGFGLLPWDAPYLGPLQLLSLGVWPILMGISMYLQMKMNPQPPDPVQAKIFMLMPIMFTFMLGSFAAGLVIYWTWNNVLSIAQQWAITRRLKARQAAAKLAKKT
jgi:YidC/Oxa1 family membrane protein insertase